MENLLINQYALYSLIFSQLLNGGLHENICTINPAIMENTEWLIVEVHTSLINLKLSDMMYHYASLCF